MSLYQLRAIPLLSTRESPLSLLARAVEIAIWASFAMVSAYALVRFWPL